MMVNFKCRELSPTLQPRLNFNIKIFNSALIIDKCSLYYQIPVILIGYLKIQ